MKNTIKYKTAPANLSKAISKAVIVPDFLPAPEKLKLKEPAEKITINLTKSSLSYYRKKAKELSVPYQQIIKKVLDLYAMKYA